MKNKIGLIILSGVLLVFGFVVFKYSNNNQQTDINQDEVATTTEAVVIDTSDWETYQNDEYGYRFKYPSYANIENSKDPKYNIYDLSQSTFVILPAKYPNIKHFDPYNPETFENYTINIVRKGSSSEFGNSDEEILKNITDSDDVFEKIIKDNYTLIAYRNKAVAQIIGKESIYTIYLEGFDPKEKYAREWVENINNPQLTEWLNNYPDYLKIFGEVYSSFEIIK